MNKVERIYLYVLILTGMCLAFFYYQIYIPKNIFALKTVTYTAPKGWGDDEIALELQKIGIIKSSLAFRFYVVLSGKHGKIQAGKYNLSSGMPIAEIVGKFINGEIVREKITILEGWDLKDVQGYLAEKSICTEEDFSEIVNKDYSAEFLFLEDKPKNLTLEGYIFPDTYDISVGESCENFIKRTLVNFEKKLNQNLILEIIRQKKTIFDIVREASILEKEVAKIEDKKMVAGILNNRLEAGMPLQIDATINYITGKNHAGVLIADTKIDSPYNTYKYAGLPLGPISNPGMNSIMAAIFPAKNNYFYYLSTREGVTVFSRTFAEHSAARVKYSR